MSQGGERFGSILIQALVIVVILLCARILLVNTQANLEARNIASGFVFLPIKSGMPISDYLLPYTTAGSYGYAFFIGILNTLYVAAIGIVFVTIIGVFVGIARFTATGLWQNLQRLC